MKSSSSQIVIFVLFVLAIVEIATSSELSRLRSQGSHPHWLSGSNDNRDGTLRKWHEKKPTVSSSEANAALWSSLEASHDNHEFKGCIDPSEPFQCPLTNLCIALQFICDGNPGDCPNNLDENEETCIAVKRPAKDNIEKFLRAEYTIHGPQFFTFLFGENFSNIMEKKISYWLGALASAFSVSKNIASFGAKLRMSPEDLAHFRRVMQKIQDGRLEEMPLFAQEAVNQGLAALIEKLNQSGFMDD